MWAISVHHVSLKSGSLAKESSPKSVIQCNPNLRLLLQLGNKKIKQLSPQTHPHIRSWDFLTLPTSYKVYSKTDWQTIPAIDTHQNFPVLNQSEALIEGNNIKNIHKPHRHENRKDAQHFMYSRSKPIKSNEVCNNPLSFIEYLKLKTSRQQRKPCALRKSKTHKPKHSKTLHFLEPKHTKKIQRIYFTIHFQIKFHKPPLESCPDLEKHRSHTPALILPLKLI